MNTKITPPVKLIRKWLLPNYKMKKNDIRFAANTFVLTAGGFQRKRPTMKRNVATFDCSSRTLRDLVRHKFSPPVVRMKDKKKTNSKNA